MTTPSIMYSNSPYFSWAISSLYGAINTLLIGPQEITRNEIKKQTYNNKIFFSFNYSLSNRYIPLISIYLNSIIFV